VIFVPSFTSTPFFDWLGTALGTAKTRLFYAREKLTELLGAEGIMAAAI